MTTIATRNRADVEATVLEARRRHAEDNPLSLAWHQQAVGFMPGGNTRTVLFYDPFPLGIASGEGCRITDVDGHEYVDLLGEYTAGLFGHSDEAVRTAVMGALERGLNLSGQTTTEVQLAAEVTRRFPSIELVRFTNSGTEANLLALATATMATGRDTVLVFDGSYHGSVLSFPAGGANPVNVPHDFLVCEYNSIPATREAIRDAGDRLAAVLVEPMLGAGGCVPADPAFLEMLREETSRVGALLVFDEVMTSRLAVGGRQGLLGISPDLTTLGKYLGGGMSFGAFGGRADLMDRFDPRRPDFVPHAGTFNNNTLSMTAGHAALTKVLTDERLAELNGRGDDLRAALNEVLGPVGAQATGLGSLLTVHFALGAVRTGADVARGDKALGELFFLDMLRKGFHLARRGMVSLSLPVGDRETTAFVEAVEEFVSERQVLLHESDQPAAI